MDGAERIDLAHACGFRLGRLAVDPALRQIVRDDRASEVLEPRVMQVLVALAQADGAILSRADLTRCCWEDRIVGEDAINRVISRLRRVADGIGAGSFRVETITKVGYRLIAAPGAITPAADRIAAPPADHPAGRPAAPVPTPHISRRLVLSGALAAVGLAGAGAWRSRHRGGPAPAATDGASPLVPQALLAMQQDTVEGMGQAIGLLRRVVAERPDDADAWGMLALAYACTAHWKPSAEADELRTRARAALVRSERLAAGNPYTLAVRAIVTPVRGRWRSAELGLRAALARQPANWQFGYMLAIVMAQVDRADEAAAIFRRLLREAPPTPDIYFKLIQALWSANRLDEADRLIDEATGIFPSQFAIWFSRVYIAMYGGRAEQALGMLRDERTRPTGIVVHQFDQVAEVAEAMISRDPAAVDRTMRTWLALAHEGSGHAENMIQFACALGRLDEAFAVSEAYFFGRGFTVPELRFSREQGSYAPLRERQPTLLFNPATAPMRADLRFAALTAELGLERYWRQAGVVPDYRRG